MPELTWSPEYETRHAQMDDTHREFVEHLQAVDAACKSGDDARLLSCFDAFAAHTVDHFAREDAWMQQHGFAPENCHSLQHRQVLEVVAEVRRLFVEGGQRQYMEQLLPALMQWFVQHAQAADYALAQFLLEPAESGAASPHAAAATGCGSVACST